MYGYSAEALHTTASREFQAHRHFLWGLCYRMTGSAADADDLVQETFARAIERPPADLTDGWRWWLSRVASHLAMDALRCRKRREYVGPWLPAPIETGAEVSRPRESASPDLSLQHRYDLVESVSVAFLLALEPLTPRQRALLILRDVFDSTVPETARVLDLTQANVKATHHRARAAMKAYDDTRRPPTGEQQARTAEQLCEFLIHLQNQDAAAVEAMLAREARALSDAAGEFYAARLPIVGRKNVARLLTAFAVKHASNTSLAFRMLNGMPAVVAEVRAPQGWAPRWVFQIELDPDGLIRSVHTVLASRKLKAVRFGTM
jgi:RNA polymerase sigma-70 factor, ECF subfamily